MKKYVALMLVFALLIGMCIGAKIQEKQYIKRALEIPEKDTFTNQDIEHILYNTPINSK